MSEQSIPELMKSLGEAAKAAGHKLATSTPEAKNQALIEGAKAIRVRSAEIIEANEVAVAAAKEKGFL